MSVGRTAWPFPLRRGYKRPYLPIGGEPEAQYPVAEIAGYGVRMSRQPLEQSLGKVVPRGLSGDSQQVGGRPGSRLQHLRMGAGAVDQLDQDAAQRIPRASRPLFHARGTEAVTHRE